MFIWQSIVGVNNSIPRGAIYGPYILQNHEYWRLITGSFMHGGILHILLNMLALYQVGMFVEMLMGSSRMALVYAIALLCSALAATYFNYNDPVVGASGAIFGLFGALVAIGIHLGKPGRQLITQTLPIIVLNLIFGFSIANIANSAHIGGLISGFLAGLLFYRPQRPVYVETP